MKSVSRETALAFRVGVPTRLRVEAIRDKLSNRVRVATNTDAYRTLVLVGWRGWPTP